MKWGAAAALFGGIYLYGFERGPVIPASASFGSQTRSLRMRLEKSAIIGILIAVGSAIPSIAADTDFKVVINVENSTSSISKKNLSDCFMKEANTYTWISGQYVVPVDLAATSETRSVFSKKIHGRDVSAVKSFWQRQIFSGRAVPPPEKASDEDVLAFVRSNPGAVGYVSSDAVIGQGVKILEVTDE